MRRFPADGSLFQSLGYRDMLAYLTCYQVDGAKENLVPCKTPTSQNSCGTRREYRTQQAAVPTSPSFASRPCLQQVDVVQWKFC